MAIKVILHIMGEEPLVADMEHEPDPKDAFVRVANLRRRDGKDPAGLEPGVLEVIYPWHRLTFIEIMPSKDTEREVVDFFRV